MTARADLVRLEPLRAEIRRAFDFWNERVWDGELPVPVFNFHPQPPNGARLGHFLEDAWKAGDRRSRDQDEIVFYADLCLKEGMRQVLATLVHEMVHLWQRHHGVPSRNNHHNLQWHAEARRAGFRTTKGDYRGHTEPAAEFEAALKAFEPRVTGIPFRLDGRSRKAPPTGKQKKWVCRCGDYSVRVAIANFDATCNRCGKQFRAATTR